jgi:hypothetical protein
VNFDTEIKTYRYLYGSVFEVSNYKDGDDAENLCYVRQT